MAITVPGYLNGPIIIDIVYNVMLFATDAIRRCNVLCSNSTNHSNFVATLCVIVAPLLTFLVLHHHIAVGIVIDITVTIINFCLLYVASKFNSVALTSIILLSATILFTNRVLIVSAFKRGVSPVLLSFKRVSAATLLD